jgi:SAM-dependent methyltransferase
LPLTGERTVPGVWHENYWFRRHEAAYRHLLPYAKVRTVVEIGSGEGYGTAAFADVAQRVVGIDYDALTVAQAASRYPQAVFVRGNLAALPVRTACADVVAALQVIEHVWDHEQFLRECRRVLAPDGVLLVTTPNRLTFSPGRETPVNPFHTHEFTADELAGLFGGCAFTVTDGLGLHAGPRLRGLDAAYGGSFAGTQLAAVPESWSKRLAEDVAAVTTADFAVTPGDLDAALDLVVVARPAV